jgi:hypothetical protein
VGDGDGVPDAARDAVGRAEALRPAEGVGEPDGDGSGEVADGEGEAGAGEATADAIGAVTGSARGGSYAVPVITVCTPHQDSVTAAPVAHDHAST